MSINPAAVLAEARDKATLERRLRRAEEERRMREHEEARIAGANFVSEHLQHAGSAEYCAWLKGWILQGGKIGHVYDYPLREDNFYVSVKDIVEVPKMYGASAIQIIVPVGISAPKLTGHMPYGHSNLYFMDGFEMYGDVLPSIYSNIKL